MVIGVHKAATTSLYHYIGDHPLVFKPKIKEIHYFSPIAYGMEISKKDRYEDYFKEASSEQYLLDVSPTYFYGGLALIDHIRKLNGIRIILILRNPVLRFISDYKQAIKEGRISKTEKLIEFFYKSNNEFKKFLITGCQKNEYHNRALREGYYAYYLPFWYKSFGNRLKILFFEDLVSNSQCVMEELCNWLSLYNIYSNYNFSQQNKSYNPRFQFISSISEKIFLKYEIFFRKNVKIKNFMKTVYTKINVTRFEAFDESTIELIQQFYKPCNEELWQILDSYSLPVPEWI
jgi:hypothetical protein